MSRSVQRLDQALVNKGLAASRASAQSLIDSHSVLVNGSVAFKASRAVLPADQLLVVRPARFVGRGGEKLFGVLDELAFSPIGMDCLDVGSSTGGFVDCLLQAGASRVTALDVGTSQLDDRLRQDPRVEVMEKTDIRGFIPTPSFSGGYDLITCDLSFISVKLVASELFRVASISGSILLCLVKPQFEVGHRDASAARGVIRDPDLWRASIDDVASELRRCGFHIRGIYPSRLRGTSGNQEFFIYASATGASPEAYVISDLVDVAVDSAIKVFEMKNSG